MDQNTSQPPYIPPPPAPPRPEKREGAGIFSKIVNVFKGIATIFSSIVKLLFAVIGIILLGSILSGLSASKSDGTTTYREVLYSGTTDTIAVIDLSGTILDVVPQGPFDAVTDTQLITPRKVLKLLEEIKYDDTVKAVVLRINSPGGSVTASEEIYQTVKRFREQTRIPVIVSQGEVAASGGYYISLAGDTIMSDPTTLTGSIGVIASTLNFQELANQYGVKEIAVTSGQNKNFFSPFDEVSDEERTILQIAINEMYDQFLTRIRDSRTVNEGTLQQLADGRPLTGKQAHNAQLVDELGNFYDAIELARTKSGHPNAQVVEYTDEGIFEGIFGAVSKPFISKLPFSFLTPYSQLTGKPAYWFGGM